jgi:catechol-2,3-dioxygenase
MQVLALFDRSVNEDYQGIQVEKSSIDHIAFTIALEDFEMEKSRLESLGCTVSTATHAWVQWRSLYFYDPEGNLVEFVCYDATI